LIAPTTAIEICRFLHDSALLVLWGTAAFIGFLLPRSLQAETVSRLSSLPVGAAVLSLATTVVTLPLQAASIGSGWGDAVDWETLGAVLFDSSVGAAWQAQAAAGVALLLAFAVGRKHRMAAVAVCAAMAIATLSLTGHASMGEGWQRIAQRSNDIVHLLSGGAWLGALLPFLVVMKMLDVAELHGPAQLALRRFSTAGHGAVVLVVATGVVNSWMVLGRWPTDWSAPYQLMLSLKIAAVMVMTGLAVVNRYVFVPIIARNPATAIRAIRLASVVEILLGLAAVGLVAVFGTLDPF